MSDHPGISSARPALDSPFSFAPAAAPRFTSASHELVDALVLADTREFGKFALGPSR